MEFIVWQMTPKQKQTQKLKKINCYNCIDGSNPIGVLRENKRLWVRIYCGWGGFILFGSWWLILDRHLLPERLQSGPGNPKYGLHTSSNTPVIGGAAWAGRQSWIELLLMVSIHICTKFIHFLNSMCVFLSTFFKATMYYIYKDAHYPKYTALNFHKLNTPRPGFRASTAA